MKERRERVEERNERSQSKKMSQRKERLYLSICIMIPLIL